MKTKLAEKAVLMRLAISVPGEHRQDPELTADVQGSHGLGRQSGKWIKNLYPPEALSSIKQLDNKARSLHNSLTLRYDVGTGILPGGLIPHYGDRMNEFSHKRTQLMEEFLSDPRKWVEWGIQAHNGTFNPDEYPGCRKIQPGECTPQSVAAVLCGQDYVLDEEEFRTVMREKFAFSTTPLPVPESGHFSETMSTLLGVDTQSVDQRVEEASVEAQKELLYRLLEPVRAMAQKLAEQPKKRKDGKEAKDIVFRDSLVENLREIARIGPALNIEGDQEIDKFITEIEQLATVEPKDLRDNLDVRSDAQKRADALAKKLSAYKF